MRGFSGESLFFFFFFFSVNKHHVLVEEKKQQTIQSTQAIHRPAMRAACFSKVLIFSKLNKNKTVHYKGGSRSFYVELKFKKKKIPACSCLIAQVGSGVQVLESSCEPSDTSALKTPSHSQQSDHFVSFQHFFRTTVTVFWFQFCPDSFHPGPVFCLHLSPV